MICLRKGQQGLDFYFFNFRKINIWSMTSTGVTVSRAVCATLATRKHSFLQVGSKPPPQGGALNQIFRKNLPKLQIHTRPCINFLEMYVRSYTNFVKILYQYLY